MTIGSNLLGCTTKFLFCDKTLNKYALLEMCERKNKKGLYICKKVTNKHNHPSFMPYGHSSKDTGNI
jgi:hypothetical protein